MGRQCHGIVTAVLAAKAEPFDDAAAGAFGRFVVVIVAALAASAAVAHFATPTVGIVVAIDAKRDTSKPNGWGVYTHGGRNATELDAIEWAQKAVKLGAGEILLTSMDADGTKAGYDVQLTRAVSEAVEVPVIASGGAGTLDHMTEVLTEGKASAVLAASIFHFGTFTIPETKEHLQKAGIPVRL